jgi:hypothetical protein
MKYFANAAREWHAEFFKGIPVITRSEWQDLRIAKTVRGLGARSVFELVKNAFPCISGVSFVQGCPWTASSYKVSTREIVVNGKYIDGNIGASAATLHEIGHALQHSVYGAKAFTALVNDVEGKVAIEADAWRHAFHLISKFNVLAECELHAAKAHARYCISTYVEEAGEKLPQRLEWLA